MASMAMRASRPPQAVITLLLCTGFVGCAQDADDRQPPPLSLPPLLTETTATWGVDTQPPAARTDGHFMPDSMGPGCAVFDADGDGLNDLLVVGSSRDAGVHRFWRQQAAGRFERAGTDAEWTRTGYGMGAAVGDIDQDGDLDCFISQLGGDALLRNAGDGTFTEVAAAAGVQGTGWSASAGFFDADADGLDDLFVTRYLEFDNDVRGHDAAGRDEYPSPAQFAGVSDRLYRNLGGGRFADVSHSAGIDQQPGKGLGLICADLNGDNAVDVYVANDGEANFAWINRGDGTFTDQAFPMGLAVNAHGAAEAGMGIAAGDVDADGDLDLLVTHLVQETHTLYEQTAAGVFHDATSRSGLARTTIDATGFGTEFSDLDLDGDLDLLVANGRVLRGAVDPDAALAPHWRAYAERDQVLWNDGRGSFVSHDLRCGALCAEPTVSRGLIASDLDGDGDPDVVVTHADGGVRLYRNDSDDSWLTVVAVDGDERELGVRFDVQTPTSVRTYWTRRARSYLSSGPARRSVGLGESPVESIVVHWPGGNHESFVIPAVNRHLRLQRGTGTVR